MNGPDVTVITPVHNTLAGLGPWFDSVLGQSLPRQRIEVIAVDDGCTDGSAEVLDRLAAEHPDLLTVLHQPPSGGPAGPRNRALDLAAGRYVFFLDSDDRLGPEALERLVGHADRADADVVLGRMAGVNGRRVPQQVFRCSLDRAAVDSSGILYALTPAKLFRRELLERHRLRFREELRIGSDHPFVLESYLRARGVAVLADYTCYYLVARDGGGNISLGDSVTAEHRLPYMRAAAETVRALSGPGPELDALIRRQLRVELTDLLGPAFAALPPAARRREAALLLSYANDWCPAGFENASPSWVRLRIHCLRNGMLSELCELVGAEKSDRLGFRIEAAAKPPVVIEGRAHADLPGFQDPDWGIPDACYDITSELPVTHRLTGVGRRRGGGLRLCGTATIEALAPAVPRVRVLARERGSGRELVLPGRGRGAAFRAHWPSGPSGRSPGTWDLFAVVRQGGVTREARIGRLRPDGLTLPPSSGTAPLTCYWTTPYDNLSVRVGGAPARRRSRVRRLLGGLRRVLRGALRRALRR